MFYLNLLHADDRAIIAPVYYCKDLISDELENMKI